MGANFFIVIFILSHLLILHSAQQQEPFHPPGCTPFYCGDLGTIGFPFSNTSHPECGLCEVDCEGKKIKLGKESEWYHVFSISQPYTIGILDRQLYESFNSRRCDSLKNLTFPSSPISFRVLNNFTTFIKCNNKSEFTSETNEQFRNNYNCTDCPGYYLYHNHTNEHGLGTTSLPPNCSVIQLPAPLLPPPPLPLQPPPPPPPHTNIIDPFQLVTAQVLLRWNVSDECLDCLRREGECHTIDDDEFNCANVKQEESDRTLIRASEKRNTTVILASVIPGGFFIICVVVFIIWRRNKWNYLPYFLSKNTSSDLSSARDVEGGSVYFGVSVFSYSELEEATNNFDPSKELGDGGFGTVYYGKLRDGREVAVKRLYENTYKRVEQFLNEIEILTRMRHRNLVLLYGCTSRRSSELLLVYEYIPNGTVADHLHGDRARPGSLPWPIRMNIAIETASALVYLHANDIIHRDVKTNNILLDNNFCVKVADFGLSRLFPIGVTHVSTAPQGTPGYVDPEYHQCYQLTDKSDVYSFGVVLIELISSMPAVDISRHRHEINLANLAINRIQNSAFSELIDPCLGYDSDAEVERMTTSVAELAFRCLQLEKELRPTMDEVLEVLKEIQDYDNVSGDLKNGRPPLPPSPESDVAVLLNDTSKAPSSPNSVTDKWVSSRSTTASSS